jgi:hypothetical protein
MKHSTKFLLAVILFVLVAAVMAEIGAKFVAFGLAVSAFCCVWGGLVAYLNGQ